MDIIRKLKDGKCEKCIYSKRTIIGNKWQEKKQPKSCTKKRNSQFSTYAKSASEQLSTAATCQLSQHSDTRFQKAIWFHLI